MARIASRKPYSAWIGWSMAEHMRAKLVNDTLLMAVWKRKPRKGLIWHADRGSQYTSDSHLLRWAWF